MKDYEFHMSAKFGQICRSRPQIGMGEERVRVNHVTVYFDVVGKHELSRDLDKPFPACLENGTFISRGIKSAPMVIVVHHGYGNGVR